MYRRFWVVFVILAIVPSVDAEVREDVGPASVGLEDNNPERCSVKHLQVGCLGEHDDNGTIAPGDDEVTISKEPRRIRVAASGPGLPKVHREVEVDVEHTTVEHPLFVAFASTDDQRKPLLGTIGIMADAAEEGFTVGVPEDIAGVHVPTQTEYTYYWGTERDLIGYDYVRLRYGLNPDPSDDLIWDHEVYGRVTCHMLPVEVPGCPSDAFVPVTEGAKDATPNLFLSLYYRRVGVMVASNQGHETFGHKPSGDSGELEAPESASGRSVMTHDDGADPAIRPAAQRDLSRDETGSYLSQATPALPLTPTGPASISIALALSLLFVLGPLLALYRRIHARKVLDHPVRAAMVEVVKKSPGITVTDAGAAAGVDFKTALHHAKVLADYGHVDMSRQGRFIRLFENHSRYGVNEKRYVVAFESDSRRRITKAILLEPGITQRELRERLDFAKSTVNFHVTKLAESGIVQPHPECRQGYFVAPELRNKVIDALVMAAESPLAGRAGYQPANASGARAN